IDGGELVSRAHVVELATPEPSVVTVAFDGRAVPGVQVDTVLMGVPHPGRVTGETLGKTDIGPRADGDRVAVPLVRELVHDCSHPDLAGVGGSSLGFQRVPHVVVEIDAARGPFWIRAE